MLAIQAGLKRQRELERYRRLARGDGATVKVERIPGGLVRPARPPLMLTPGGQVGMRPLLMPGGRVSAPAARVGGGLMRRESGGALVQGAFVGVEPRPPGSIVVSGVPGRARALSYAKTAGLRFLGGSIADRNWDAKRGVYINPEREAGKRVVVRGPAQGPGGKMAGKILIDRVKLDSQAGRVRVPPLRVSMW